MLPKFKRTALLFMSYLLKNNNMYNIEAAINIKDSKLYSDKD